MKSRTFALAAIIAAGITSAKAEDVTLQMVVWNYSIDTIQANLKEFEAANPGIKVQLALAQTLALLFTAIVIFSNFLADVAHQLVDPRVRDRARVT